MPEIIVAAESRTETGKNANRRLRTSGMIPGVLYGEKKKAVQIAVSPKEIGSILRSKTGENTLFDLELDGSRRKVILKEFQLEPIKGALLHADFYEVALDKELHVKVHVEVVGVAIGVKRDGGVLDFVTRELEIACLPTDIPEKIVVDVLMSFSSLYSQREGRSSRCSESSYGSPLAAHAQCWCRSAFLARADHLFSTPCAQLMMR